MKGARVCSLSKSELTLHELSFLESQGRRNLWHLPDGGLLQAKKVYTKEVDRYQKEEEGEIRTTKRSCCTLSNMYSDTFDISRCSIVTSYPICIAICISILL